jgi:hypothetical protein
MVQPDSQMTAQAVIQLLLLLLHRTQTYQYQHHQALVLPTGLQILDLGGLHTYTTQVTPVTARLAMLVIVVL